MYAIIQLGSVQYKVAEGDVIKAQLLGKKEGTSIDIDKVLLWSDGKETKVGQPYLRDVKVTATIDSHIAAPKVISFKHRRRKNSKWTKGHRQKLDVLTIKKIKAA